MCECVLSEQTQLVAVPSHLLARARAADASEQSIDHLDETEDELHAGCHQQRGEQSHVEFNNVLWFFTPLPHVLVSQVASVAANEWCQS